MTNNKTAIVIGATGLVGNELVKQLIDNISVNKIKLFVRRKTNFNSAKIVEEIVDFDKLDEWKKMLIGDILYLAFGTTIKKAKTKENQYKIDYTYQYEIAKAAQSNGIQNVILVSSAGADSKSKVFYSRIKGELDENIKNLGFKKVSILRPSILDGDRKEKRIGEIFGLFIMKFMCTIIHPLKKYRPIDAKIVAKAMINAAETSTGTYSIYSLDKVFWLAASTGKK